MVSGRVGDQGEDPAAGPGRGLLGDVFVARPVVNIGRPERAISCIFRGVGTGLAGRDACYCPARSPRKRRFSATWRADRFAAVDPIATEWGRGRGRRAWPGRPGAAIQRYRLCDFGQHAYWFAERSDVAPGRSSSCCCRVAPPKFRKGRHDGWLSAGRPRTGADFFGLQTAGDGRPALGIRHRADVRRTKGVGRPLWYVAARFRAFLPSHPNQTDEPSGSSPGQPAPAGSSKIARDLTLLREILRREAHQLDYVCRDQRVRSSLSTRPRARRELRIQGSRSEKTLLLAPTSRSAPPRDRPLPPGDFCRSPDGFFECYRRRRMLGIGGAGAKLVQRLRPGAARHDPDAGSTPPYSTSPTGRPRPADRLEQPVTCASG